MTSLSLKGDDASLNSKHRYQLGAFPAAFQTRVNTNPTWHNEATNVADNGALDSSATSAKWLKDFQTSLTFAGR